MDLRSYYRKIEDVEKTIAGSDAVVISVATPDGGREGVKSQVPRSIAAKLIVEGKARLADEIETDQFHREAEEVRLRAAEASALERIQVRLVTDSELPNLTRGKRHSK
ncbi:MAG: hypothetical protein FJW20_02480 [Acidimicrobiia bacterium]|nr:hypothetical protein [Acidimicrobiia bacterium]